MLMRSIDPFKALGKHKVSRKNLQRPVLQEHCIILEQFNRNQDQCDDVSCTHTKNTNQKQLSNDESSA